MMIASNVPQSVQLSFVTPNTSHPIDLSKKVDLTPKPWGKHKKPKHPNITISLPDSTVHHWGIKKGSSSTEKADVDHAIKELLKVAGLESDVLNNPEHREILEDICMILMDVGDTFVN